MAEALFITDRLIIRKFVLEDASFIKLLLNDSGWLRFIGDRKVHSNEDAKNYIANSILLTYQKFGFGPFAIQLIQTGELIGMSCLLKREALEFVDIGYALLKEYTGKGYAYEAILATQDYAHKILQIKQLAAITNEDNISSKNLLEKLNFHYSKKIILPGEKQELYLFLESN